MKCVPVLLDVSKLRSSVGIVTDYMLECRGAIPDRDNGYFFTPQCPDQSSLEVKGPEREADHSVLGLTLAGSHSLTGPLLHALALLT